MAFIGNLVPWLSKRRGNLAERDVISDVIDVRPTNVASRSIVEKSVDRKASRNLELEHLAVDSYEPTDFRPLWWLRNHHLQTIAGLYLPRTTKLEFERERFYTACGGFFDVDTHYATNEKGVVILCHGLESKSRGPHTMRIMKAMAERGFTSTAMNFRGCSGDANMSIKDYHLSFTEDLSTLVDVVAQRVSDNTRIYLSGFSLGANVVLKYLSELTDAEVKERKISGAAVQCVPFDPVACQTKLEKGFSRAVYSRRFLSSLKKKAFEKAKLFPELVNVDKVRSARTIRDFDDAYIAPIFGFESCLDYYKKSDTKPLLSRVGVPTLVVNSLDDPFIESSRLPTPQDVGSAPVKLVYTSGGGHLGFVQSVRGESYTSTEMARFISHVERLYSQIDHSHFN